MRKINDDLTVAGTISAREIRGDFCLTETNRKQFDDMIAENVAPLVEAITALAQRVDELQEQLNAVQGSTIALTEQINKNLIL